MLRYLGVFLFIVWVLWASEFVDGQLAWKKIGVFPHTTSQLTPLALCEMLRQALPHNFPAFKDTVLLCLPEGQYPVGPGEEF